MELQELVGKLEKLEGGKELAESVVSMVESEKQKGIESHRKVNKEAQALRKFKTAYDALGYEDGLDVDAFTSDLVKKINKPVSEDVNSKLTLKALNEQIQKLTSDLTKEKTVSKTKSITAKLTQALSDKVYGSDLLVKSLIADGLVDMNDDEVIFKSDDKIIGFDEGIKNLLEQRKDIVKNLQVNGSKSNGSKDIPKNINDLIQNGTPQDIMANLSQIKEQLNIKI